MEASQLFRLDGLVAIVTGASRGIGRELALGLGAAGASVAVLGRNRAALERVSAELKGLGRRTQIVTADVTDSAQVDAAVAEVIANFGRLDVVVNAAGAQITGPSSDFSDEAWDTVVDANLKGTFLMCRAAAKQALLPQGSGKIVNLAATFFMMRRICWRGGWP